MEWNGKVQYITWIITYTQANQFVISFNYYIKYIGSNMQITINSSFKATVMQCSVKRLRYFCNLFAILLNQGFIIIHVR